MLNGAKENIEEIGHGGDYFKDKILVADVNYHGPENLKSCEDEHLDAYIPDKNFRKRDPRFANQGRWSKKKSKRFALEDFHYHEAMDEYVCPNGKRLKRNVRKLIRDGVIARRYRTDEGDCKYCKLRSHCLIGKNSKRRSLDVPMGWAPGNPTGEMAQKIDTEKGRNIYHQRIAIVEPVFANIKCMKGLDRFTLRGKIKVNIQWVLYCMVHNICKIKRYGFT